MMRVPKLGALIIPLFALAMTGCGSTSTAGGGGGNLSPSPIPAGAVTIKVVANTQTVGAFDPSPATARVNQPVAWQFTDSGNQHTVTSDDGSFPDSGTQSAGYVFYHTFSQAGTFKYHCSLHSAMLGQITVTQ